MSEEFEEKEKDGGMTTCEKCMWNFVCCCILFEFGACCCAPCVVSWMNDYKKEAHARDKMLAEKRQQQNMDKTPVVEAIPVAEVEVVK